MLFIDRKEAGKALGQALKKFSGNHDAIVLALPRGGVVLGYEICKQLHLKLDLILVRKLGVPDHEELAFGAIAMNNLRVLNEDVIDMLKIDNATIQNVVTSESAELQRRNSVYRQGAPFPNLKNKIVILVDDGIATGATMRAAIKVVTVFKPKKILVAVPVASPTIYEEMANENVELLVLKTPSPFLGIGMWYQDFPQVSDHVVLDLLAKAQGFEK